MVFIFFSCAKEPEHSIRFSNETDRVVAITLNDSIFYEIEPKQRTGYRWVEEGQHAITGDYEAKITITGNGVYKWTIFIEEDNVRLVRDM